MAILKESFSLENGLFVKVHLHPMPKQVDGIYPTILDSENFPSVSVSFYNHITDQEGGDPLVFIKKLHWNDVFSSPDGYVALKGNYHLAPNDVIELDAKGWSVLSKYGLYPTSLRT